MAVTQGAGIMAFENAEFGTIRAVSEGGEPWFVAKDVCDALGIRSDTVRKIVDHDDVTESNPNTIGVVGGRNPLLVSEAGFYTLVLKSRKPEAKAFQRWVTHSDGHVTVTRTPKVTGKGQRYFVGKFAEDEGRLFAWA